MLWSCTRHLFVDQVLLQKILFNHRSNAIFKQKNQVISCIKLYNPSECHPKDRNVKKMVQPLYYVKQQKPC